MHLSTQRPEADVEQAAEAASAPSIWARGSLSRALTRMSRLPVFVSR